MSQYKFKQIGEYRKTCCGQEYYGHIYTSESSSRVFNQKLKVGTCITCGLEVLADLTNVQGIITKPEYEVVEDVE